MVETIGDITVASFISGSFKLDPKLLDSNQWAEIIEGAVKELQTPLRKVESMKSIQRLLVNPLGDVHRRVEPQCIEHLGRSSPPTHQTYASLADLEAFPRSWTAAYERGTHTLPISTQHVLLSSDGELFVLEADWNPHEVWGERGRIPDIFAYTTTSIRVSDKSQLPRYLEESGEKSAIAGAAGIAILMRLMNLANEIREEFRNDERSASRQHQKIRRRLERLGAW